MHKQCLSIYHAHCSICAGGGLWSSTGHRGFSFDLNIFQFNLNFNKVDDHKDNNRTIIKSIFTHKPIMYTGIS